MDSHGEDEKYSDEANAYSDSLILAKYHSDNIDEDQLTNANQLNKVDVLSGFGMDTETAREISTNQLCENRLFNELVKIYKSDLVNTATSSYHLRLIDNDIHIWHLKIKEFPEPCHLNRELAMHYPSNENVTIELKFPPEYPVVPPFLRVVSPAIQAGHVILGGAIFLDVLLPKKCEIMCSTQTYSPAIELLQLFFQLAQSMVDGNARVDTATDAVDGYSFERAKFMHDSNLGLMDLDWNAVFDDFSADKRSDFMIPSFLSQGR